MSTQGKGTYVINSGWSSGSLVFYEKAVGRTATGDVLTIGAAAVTIGGTAQDVDFGWYATGSKSFVLDAGAGTMTLAGIDVTITGDLTIDTEDIALGDNDSLEFGDAADVAITWNATNLAIIPAADNTGEIQFGNDGTKSMDVRFYGATASYNVLWDNDGGTNGAWYFGANTYGITVSMFGITTGCGVFWVPSGDTNNGTFSLGASGGSKGVDLYAYGATNGNYLQWDQSANSLLLVGTSTVLNVAGTTASTTATTGALIVAGGAGINGAVNLGSTLGVTGVTTLTGGLLVDGDALIELGQWPGSTSAPDTVGIHLGTSKIRAVVVAANDGAADPIKRIESSCHTFLQGVDWATGWSATALEGAFYGGFDLIATEDNMNVSGAGGWIYLNDESGYSTAGTAPVIGTDAGKWTFVCGLESWVAVPADVDVKACGIICGLKLSNNFISGASPGSGKFAAIYIETANTRGYDYMIATNAAANGFVANTHTLTLTETAYHMLINIGGTDYYIPVFDNHEWS